MRHILRRYCELMPGLNERALTERDFYAFADRENLLIHHTSLGGLISVYFNYDGRQGILFDEDLSGLPWLYVAWHEIGHYLAHAPCPRHGHGYSPRCEQEAEAFALLALFPAALFPFPFEENENALLNRLRHARVGLWRRWQM